MLYARERDDDLPRLLLDNAVLDACVVQGCRGDNHVPVPDVLAAVLAECVVQIVAQVFEGLPVRLDRADHGPTLVVAGHVVVGGVCVLVFDVTGRSA